jgi:uncharacterized surface protein with fasciclin (FAS1) repeats
MTSLAAFGGAGTTPRSPGMTIRQLMATAAIVPALLFVAGCSDETETGSGATETTGVTADEAGATGGGGDADAEPPMGTPPSGDTAALNIAQIAAGTAATQELTRLVLQAGLLPTVRDGGPFTVFAPVDAAFAAIPAEQLAELQADQAQLAEVLTLHVVPGTLTAADLREAATSGRTLTTVQGGQLRVEARGGDTLIVGGATIAVADIMASNGVVHAIDTVITAPNG